MAPPPEVARTAHDDGRGLRAPRRVTLTVVVVIALLIGLPALALSGHIRTEWSLAFGATTMVDATVTGSAPSDQVSRGCSLVNIDVVWTAPVGTHSGQFTVCEDQAGQFPFGAPVRVAVVPGDRSVIQGEGRGSAIFGVVLETLVLLLILLLLAAGLRQWLQLATARRHWRSAPWLPGTVFPAPPGRAVGQPVLVIPPGDPVPWTRPAPGKARRRTCLADDVPVLIGRAAEERGLDPQAAVRLNVQRRGDHARLAEGDQVWLAPASRTLGGHHRTGPYAIIRASDQLVFWATARPLPGDNW
ncbi:MAG TPA: hypothetical protein VH089_02115 [Streptosporangiaceae bacterium]|nr:hypothetical protein [Streptosporangiaceae bacterium]